MTKSSANVIPLFFLAASVSAARVTPVEKVVTMLEDLQTQIITEGKAEAKTYDQFACFCKDQSAEKSSEITEGNDNVADLEAAIGVLSTGRASLDEEITDLNQKITRLTDTIKAEKKRRSKQQKEYMSTKTELNKGERNLRDAIKSLKVKSGMIGLAGMKSVMQSVRETASSAEKLGVSHGAKHQQVLKALLQDPEVPMQDYSFHAGDIVRTVEDLQDDFKAKLSDMHIEESKHRGKHDVMMQEKTAALETAEKQLKEKIKLKSEKGALVATKSRELTQVSASLADDQSYLKELSSKCNAKSKEWDQRSKMRTDELTAITSALTIIKEQVAKSEKKSAFVEIPAAPRKKLNVLAKANAHSVSTSETKRQALVSALLKKKGAELKSEELVKLAATVSADPFSKIKKLVQELIERLQQEAADEANHQAWCDKQISKAKQARKARASEVKHVNLEMASLEAQRDKNQEEVETLTREISNLEDSVSKLQKERKEESEENEKRIKDAEEGKKAIQEAKDVLSKFYKTAEKAETELVQARKGHVSKDEPDAGFDGAYKGSQEESQGILGMLDVIESDFDREISETKKEEKEAAKEFSEFETTTKVSIKKKKTTKSAIETELTEVNSMYAEKKGSLASEQELLDKTLQELTELQPACIKTGMSYEEKTAKREQEVAALNQALCILNQDPTMSADC